MTDQDIAMEVAEQMAPMLHGLGPSIQGAVLADLTATWLAGVQGRDAQQVREELLAAHTAAIREMIPVNEKIMLDRMANGKRQ